MADHGSPLTGARRGKEEESPAMYPGWTCERTGESPFVCRYSMIQSIKPYPAWWNRVRAVLVGVAWDAAYLAERLGVHVRIAHLPLLLRESLAAEQHSRAEKPGGSHHDHGIARDGDGKVGHG
jgi:hypothetical protein